jgi:hypothetical protein
MPPLTTPELADRIGLPERRVDELLAESEADGILERDSAGRWRLTAEAELQYGAALRVFHPVLDVDGTPADRRNADHPMLDAA